MPRLGSRVRIPSSAPRKCRPETATSKKNRAGPDALLRRHCVHPPRRVARRRRGEERPVTEHIDHGPRGRRVRMWCLVVPTRSARKNVVPYLLDPMDRIASAGAGTPGVSSTPTARLKPPAATRWPCLSALYSARTRSSRWSTARRCQNRPNRQIQADLRGAWPWWRSSPGQGRRGTRACASRGRSPSSRRACQPRRTCRRADLHGRPRFRSGPHPRTSSTAPRSRVTSRA